MTVKSAACSDAELAEASRRLMQRAIEMSADYKTYSGDEYFTTAPGEVPAEVMDALEALAALHHYPVAHGEVPPENVLGRTVPDIADKAKSGKIFIQDGMSPVSRASTLMHEIAHVLAGDMCRDVISGMREALITMLTGVDAGDPVKEVQAQYVAGLACACLGIGNGDESAAYLAGWTQFIGIDGLTTEPEQAREEERDRARVIIEAVRAMVPGTAAAVAEAAYGTTGAL